MPDIQPSSAFRIPSLDDAEVGATFTKSLHPQLREECEVFMREDLARSGLEPQDLDAKVAVQHGGPKYFIPYYYPNGRPICAPDGHLLMYRVRLKTGANRYVQPGREAVGELCAVPYIHPRIFEFKEPEVLAICEGEKKAASVMKHIRIPSIGIGGKDNWRESGKLTVHPWITDVAQRLGVRRIVVVPDGDIQQFHIKKSYGTFAALLREEGYEVSLLHPADKIDDLIVQWGDEALTNFWDIPELQDGVEDPQYLVKRYHLSFSETKSGKVTLHPNEANAIRLLREHPRFPRIWYDEDTAVVRLDDGTELREGREDLDVLETFQYNLGVHNFKLGTIHSAISRVAYDNTRSPVRDWLMGLEWDGKERLDVLFPRYCGSQDTEAARELGAKWLIAAVARKMDPGCIVDFMVITTGRQGVGKSSLPRLLFGEERVVDLVGTESQTKDEFAKMHMSWCVNHEELSSLNGKEKEHLKAMITSRVDTFRPVYARNTVMRPRQFVMYGSTNQSEFLKQDPSGYRRWGIVRIEQVRFQELESDRDQIWAEAVARWKHGESWSNLEHAHAEAQRHVHVPDEIHTWEEYWDSGAWKENRKSVDGWYFWTRKEIAAICGIEHGVGRMSFQMSNLLEHVREYSGLVYRDTSWKTFEGKQLKRVYVWHPDSEQRESFREFPYTHTTKPS